MEIGQKRQAFLIESLPLQAIIPDMVYCTS